MKIHAIQTGTVRIKSAQREARLPASLGQIGIFADRNWTEWLPTYVWAIEHEEGVFVVDTGQATHLLALEHESLHPYLRWESRFRIETQEEVGPRLNALGIGPRDVKHVILTHFHIDHDAGLAHFPHSAIHAAPGAIASTKGAKAILNGYLPQQWPTWFDPQPLALDDGPFGPFAASKRLTSDGALVVVPTPGHTADHLSVICMDGEQTYFLAGDTSYSEALMLAGKLDGVTTNGTLGRATLAAIRVFATQQPIIYLPTHDPASGERFAKRQAVPLHGNGSAAHK